MLVSMDMGTFPFLSFLRAWTIWRIVDVMVEKDSVGFMKYASKGSIQGKLPAQMVCHESHLTKKCQLFTHSK